MGDQRAVKPASSDHHDRGPRRPRRPTGGAPPTGLFGFHRAAGNAAFTQAVRTLQRSELATQGAGSLAPDVAAAIAAEHGGGLPLPPPIRAEMEHHLGVDFSAVRVHTGPRADTLNRSVQAEAFTTGTDIFFSGSTYNPTSSHGRELLAHELTHVIQQSTGTAGTVSSVSHPADPAEVQAREVAYRVSTAGPQPEFDDEPPVVEAQQIQCCGTSSTAGCACHEDGIVQRAVATGSPQPIDADQPGGGSASPPGGTVSCPPPPDLSCEVAQSSPDDITDVLSFPVASSALSTAERAEVDSTAAAWHAASASVRVRVDGYASPEGDCIRNWHLSSRRAIAVATELAHPSDGSVGIPSSMIDVFAHGATGEFSQALAPNRLATISIPTDAAATTTAAAPSPAPSGGIAPPSTLPSKLTFWINAFIPNTLSGAHTQPTGPYAGRQVFPGPPLPWHWNSCFETDGRSFDSSFPTPPSRVSYVIIFDTAAGSAVGSLSSSLTFEVDCTTGSVKCAKMPRPRASISTSAPFFAGSRRYDLLFNVTANDPCVKGSPDIAVRGDIIVDLTSRTVDCIVLTTIFPSIEMYANLGGGVVTIFTDPAVGGVGSLFVPGLSPHQVHLGF